MTSLCEKLCENLGVNPVQIFVDFINQTFSMCEKLPSSQLFNHFSHQVFNIFSDLTHLYVFSHFHKTYNYYYDILKINNINRKV